MLYAIAAAATAAYSYFCKTPRNIRTLYRRFVCNSRTQQLKIARSDDEWSIGNSGFGRETGEAGKWESVPKDNMYTVCICKIIHAIVVHLFHVFAHTM